MCVFHCVSDPGKLCVQQPLCPPWDASLEAKCTQYPTQHGRMGERGGLPEIDSSCPDKSNFIKSLPETHVWGDGASVVVLQANSPHLWSSL